jgi:hypothetical protein
MSQSATLENGNGKSQRLQIRATWACSLDGARYHSFGEATANVLRDPRVEGTQVQVDMSRAVEFSRDGQIVASLSLSLPPQEADVRDWMLKDYEPGTSVTLQTVRLLAESANEHFNLQLAYESDWFELRRFIGETLREAGGEIPGWQDFLTAHTPVSRMNVRSYIIGREGEASTPAGEVVESAPIELLRLVVSNLLTVQEVQATLGTFARLCRARIEEIASQQEAQCVGCGKILPKAQMHEIGGIEGEAKVYACSDCDRTDADNKGS